MGEVVFFLHFAMCAAFICHNSHDFRPNSVLFFCVLFTRHCLQFSNLLHCSTVHIKKVSNRMTLKDHLKVIGDNVVK
jgi:hypothetical protein